MYLLASHNPFKFEFLIIISPIDFAPDDPILLSKIKNQKIREIQTYIEDLIFPKC